MVLAQAAAVLRDAGADCVIRDYPASGKAWDAFEREFAELDPDILFINVTGPTLREDLRACAIAKSIKPEVLTVAKGAYLFMYDKEVLGAFSDLDVAYRGEVDFRVKTLLDGSFQATGGFTFRSGNQIVRNGDADYLADLDLLPFPARELLDNSLYLSPETRKPLTVIQTARGCPYQCIFCLVPRVSGTRLRRRSVESVLGEVQQCVQRFGIREFYFNADTFTLDRDWVIELCKSIVERRLPIRWGCNSRVDTLDEARLEWMKRAGCHIITLGVESGDQSMLNRMRKGITLEQSRRAVSLCRDFGIDSYMFFIIGLPWETRETVRRSIEFALELDGDFAEFILARCFPGTELHRLCDQLGILLQDDPLSEPRFRCLELSQEEVVELQRECFRRFHLRPRYILSRLLKARDPRIAMNYAIAGLSKLRGYLTRSGVAGQAQSGRR